MRYLIMTLAAVIATSIVACGKKNDSVANPVPPYGPGSFGYCAPGAVGCVAGQFSLGGNRFGGTLEAIGQDAFAQMLGQYGGFCQNNGWNNNPSQLNWSTTFGNWNCRHYARAGYVKMRFDGTGTRVQIKVGAKSHYNAAAQEVLFNGRIYPINNSAGMEIRAAGVQGTGSWSAQWDNGLVIIIQQGAPAALQMTGEVMYRGRSMGTVHFYRY